VSSKPINIKPANYIYFKFKLFNFLFKARLKSKRATFSSFKPLSVLNLPARGDLVIQHQFLESKIKKKQQSQLERFCSLKSNKQTNKPKYAKLKTEITNGVYTNQPK
jgi:hypothetical protein